MMRLTVVAVLSLLVIDLVGCGGEAPPPAPVSIEPDPLPPSRVLFSDIAAEAGLEFSHFIGSVGEHYFTEIMGSGGALFDYDGDGDLDVYLVQGAMPEGRGAEASPFPVPDSHWPGNRLYRNELVPQGALRFTDVTDEAGVGDEGNGMGVAVGDADNDGDADLYVTNFGRNVFYRNDGDGTFSDVSIRARTRDSRWNTSASFVDYDHDGDLDLFVLSYVSFSPDYNKRCGSPTGRRDYCSPNSYEPLPDRLFRNDGNFRFTDVSEESGIGLVAGSGLGVTSADFNGDNRVDIYVANDQMGNVLWLNEGDGTFREAGLMSGTAYNANGAPEASMGVTAGDFDGDGDEDLFMTHLAAETNTLYLNNGAGSFIDATDRVRLGHGSLPFTGFGSQWFDFDNDGQLDLFVANGAVTVESEQVDSSDYPYVQTNQLFRNDGGRFEDLSLRAGPVFELAEVSRGAVFGDIDNDGDTDILVTSNNGPVRLLRNETGSETPSLSVTLVGAESPRDATGARTVLLRDGQPPLWRRAHTDGSYLSAGDARVHFGLGDGFPAAAIAVHWPSGRMEQWNDLGEGPAITLREGTGGPWSPARDKGHVDP